MWRALFGRGFRARLRLSSGIKERGIERCRQVVRFSAVGESCDQEFVAETLRVGSTSQKHEQASHFRLRRDNYLASRHEGSRKQAAKLSAVAIGCGIDGIEHFYLQDRSFGQGIYRIRGHWMKTGLQVKFQNGPCGDSNGRNGCILSRSGTCRKTDGAHNSSEGMAHGLGLSSSENTSNTIILSLRRGAVNAKRG